LGAFGEKLRKQREQRGLALDAISNTTKISTRMLRALEEEHFDQLPGGVFNKGFVRAYARQVGLDEEEAITDYLAALRESQVQSQKILPDFRNPGSKTPSATFSDSPHQIISSGGHSAVDGKDKSHDVSTAERRRNEDRRNEERRNEVRRNQDRLPQYGEPPHQLPLVAALRNNARPHDGERDHDHREPEQTSNRGNEELAKRHQDRSETRAQNTTSMPGFITLGAASEDSTESPDAPSPRLSLPTKLGAALLLLIVGLAAWLVHRHQESSPHSAVNSNPSSSVSAADFPAPTVTSAAAPPTKIAAVPPDRKLPVAKSSAPSSAISKSPTASTPKPSASASSAETFIAPSTITVLTKPPATFSLTIRADQTTWISITADGKPVVHETLIAPAHTSVRAAHEIAVRVGNAAGVSFLLNGKEFPAEGNAGEVKTYVFDDTGLKPGQSPSPTTNE
jgi:hypothetical protein